MGDPSVPAATRMASAPPNPMLGGAGPDNLAAWQDNWPKVIAFFDKALKGQQP